MRVVLVAISLLALVGCEDQQLVEKKRAEQQARAERLAKLKAQDDAERHLMTTPALAVDEIERRLFGWLTVDSGVIVLGGESRQVHALPATSPWLVTCGDAGLDIKLAHWFELEAGRYDGGFVSNQLVTKQLTSISLTEDECRPLVSMVGRKMLALLGSAQPPKQRQ
jgi:hypothetical protein